MAFKELFLNALTTNTEFTKSISLLDYLPRSIDVLPSVIENNLPYVQAYGEISCGYPYYYSISNLESYCLIYTENGSGSLTINDNTYLLDSGSLAFINCRVPYHIEVRQGTWTHKIIFMNGNPISTLHNEISNIGVVFPSSLNTVIPNMLKKFFLYLSKKEENNFIHSKLILDMLFEIIFENNSLTLIEETIPDYLLRIKNYFDTNYHTKISLESLEKEYRISKYRICREFNKYFGNSPIQYLNQKRMTVAKDNLLSTDTTINEISQLVGFENTNHFIRLFKQQTGVTPLEFRKHPPGQNLI